MGFFMPNNPENEHNFSPPFSTRNPYFSPPSSKPTMRNLRSDVQDVNATLLRLPQWRERPRMRSTISLPPGKTPMASPNKEKGGDICSKKMYTNLLESSSPPVWFWWGWIFICVYIYIFFYDHICICIPGTQIASIFEGQPLKTRPFQGDASWDTSWAESSITLW